MLNIQLLRIGKKRRKETSEQNIYYDYVYVIYVTLTVGLYKSDFFVLVYSLIF